MEYKMVYGIYWKFIYGHMYTKLNIICQEHLMAISYIEIVWNSSWDLWKSQFIALFKSDFILYIWLQNGISLQRLKSRLFQI
jgi:hypothetical protein